ncbi:MAG: phosphate/phosphite/phosphonate ABC transporter substrate-binding protein [Proteobacteria bacterium]|nr:phosphate/phosphite/phosphonate ABC transporter substrate-binding protein [Pseudomonadota bacterium]
MLRTSSLIAGLFATVAGLALLAGEANAQAAAACTNRGDLDQLYCDNDRDLVADVPADKKKLRNPSTLVFAYTPVEDPAVYESIFRPFTEYLAKCAAKKVVYYPVQSNSAEIEAMRSGRLHVAGFSSGPTGFAVNMAGAIPFAAKGTAGEYRGYHLAFVVKADSPYQKLADLKGKKVAHTSASSNSGNLAPRALFPGEGLAPEKDYQVVYSGGHDKSALGVVSGDFDGAAVASDVLERMIARGNIKAEQVRVIYKSATFPTSSFAYAHDLEPALADKIKKCFYDYRFPAEMTKEFNGDDRFFPITYKKDWEVIRTVAAASGTPYNKAQYEKETAQEKADEMKRAQEKLQQKKP